MIFNIRKDKGGSFLYVGWGMNELHEVWFASGDNE